MRNVVYAIIASGVMHIIFYGATMAVGYAKTMMYRPNIALAWGNVEMLQAKVAFGSTSGFLLNFHTLFGVALLCWIALFVYQKCNVRTKL
ncbi:hypothetical protein B0H99_103114 [Planomicrobium soli]|uniref:Uncharacterized protein n=1 Tax=Planomicrobium soli TaxID=1176648 RepID=A0A2P8H439_9BACL|nr:hypothetical protein [Planomicrobium soli]PSL40981.1 hypothetical protein B0H99_103114 [Planomicrobium soli]